MIEFSRELNEYILNKLNLTGKQKLTLLFLMNLHTVFDKKDLVAKTGLKEGTITQYLKELKEAGIIDCISHHLFADAPKSKKKHFYYGQRETIAKIKENPKARKVVRWH